MNVDVIATQATAFLRKLDIALWAKFVPAEDESVDDAFDVFCGVRETGWSVQVGHRYACVNRWIASEQTMQSWDCPTVDAAIRRLPELMKQEGYGHG